MNVKMELFAEYYAETGNATESAKRAGYSERTAYSQGQRLLKNVEIARRVQELSDKAANIRIASIVQAKAFLSDTMKDKEQKTSDRIRAAELLLKSGGAFVDRKEPTDGRAIATGSDEEVVFYYPPMLSEKDCEVTEDGKIDEGWYTVE